METSLRDSDDATYFVVELFNFLSSIPELEMLISNFSLGKMTKEYSCTNKDGCNWNDKHISSTNSSFKFVVSLSNKDEDIIDIQNLIEKFFSGKQLKTTCPLCKSGRIIETKLFENIPNYLLIEVPSLDRQLTYPELKFFNKIYELVGITKYSPGHYYCVRKFKNEWFKCNDSFVNDFILPEKHKSSRLLWYKLIIDNDNDDSDSQNNTVDIKLKELGKEYFNTFILMNPATLQATLSEIPRDDIHFFLEQLSLNYSLGEFVLNYFKNLKCNIL